MKSIKLLAMIIAYSVFLIFAMPKKMSSGMIIYKMLLKLTHL
jgi:hypothetical protein